MVLRFFMHYFERCRQIIELVLLAVRQADGVKNIFKGAIRSYHREGFAGIMWTIRTIIGRHLDRNNYSKWVHCYDTLTNKKRFDLRSAAKALPTKPLFSVIMPVYNTKPRWLIQTIQSVRKQIYPRWELCIADDASTNKITRFILKQYSKRDPRIKVVFRQQNGHISAASNSALELVTGEWVALLDHDDLLTEHALFHVAQTINHHPATRLIYSDEDKINRKDKRFSPYFKCDWNADLFYSHNMICHLGVYHAELLRDLGGFRLGFEGAQDYDLALRFIEQINPDQIQHIPRILYHRRVHNSGTAKPENAKPHTYCAGEKALNEHFHRQGINAKAELLDFEAYRVRYFLPDILPLVSLIILTRNQLQMLQKCIESILDKTTYANYEIVVVDNGSDNPATLDYLKHMEHHAKIRIIRDDRPFNYSTLNNSAVKEVRGELVGLINNDIEIISPEWLSEMVSHALRPEVGAVGAKLWYPDNTLQHAGVVLGLGGVAGHVHRYLPRNHRGYFGRASLSQSFSAVTAACLVIRKAIYEEVGGFNEEDLQVAFGDVDFCIRVREKGYRNIWTPFAELYHHESASRGLDNTPVKKKRFDGEVTYMKPQWGDLLLNDPAYNPNLTLDSEDFGLAWPPRVT